MNFTFLVLGCLEEDNVVCLTHWFKNVDFILFEELAFYLTPLHQLQYLFIMECDERMAVDCEH
jgi:hypothetical protein